MNDLTVTHEPSTDHLKFCMECITAGTGLFELDQDDECPNHGGMPEQIAGYELAAIGRLFGQTQFPAYTANFWGRRLDA